MLIDRQLFGGYHNNLPFVGQFQWKKHLNRSNKANDFILSQRHHFLYYSEIRSGHLRGKEKEDNSKKHGELLKEKQKTLVLTEATKVTTKRDKWR